MRKFVLALFVRSGESFAMSLSVIDKARLYRELAKLLGAAFPMDKAVDMLADQYPAGARGEFLRGLQSGMCAHLGLAESMRLHAARQASRMELCLVDAGERSGRLADACEHLANYFEVWHRGIREARGGMIYPLLLLHLGILLPEFARYMMMKNFGEDTPIVEAILWRVGAFWILLGILALAWRALSKAAATSETIDRALGALPLIGSLRRHWALSRFCQVFNGTLLAGIGIAEGLRLSGDASQSGVLQTGAHKTARSVELGTSLAGGMTDSARFPRMFVNSVATAEAAGGLDREMERWARAEADLAVESQRRVSDWYPKILYVFVVGYVGLRIVEFAQSYFSEVFNLERYQ